MIVRAALLGLNAVRGSTVWGLLLLLVAAQIWFAIGTRDLRAAIDEMPPAPSENALKAMAFGDDEFLFRHLTRWMEFVGDGGGRVRPLRDYDYDRVVDWLRTLDELDAYRSDMPHAIAARYFGEITSAVDPNHARVGKIVSYLELVGLHDPKRFWPWLVWDARLARKTIGDPDLMRTLAKDLQSPELRSRSIPAWVRLLPVELYQAAGDKQAAADALAKVTPEDKKEIEDDRRAMAEAIRRMMQSAQPADKSRFPSEKP
jgi:hypothetical protein